ncbi:uncharacterized protein [Leptinotarsa decemlineata]|uniref:uncharacterized protein n=1 Tax=Leptinotarsa decemlineata TaxID=7539 RepID=UPI003D30A242
MDTVQQGKKWIILGDINSKSPEWGSPTCDARGQYWAEWAATRNLVFANTGGEPTFVRRDQKSHIDITCSTAKASMDIVDWRILDEETLTDHRFIRFGIASIGQKKPTASQRPSYDWTVFRNIMELKIGNRQPGLIEYTDALKMATSGCIRRREGRLKPDPYWWNEDIEQTRNTCNKIRRTLTRLRRLTNNEPRAREAMEAYTKARRELKMKITKSKKTRWKQMCDELDNDIWGDGYKVALRSLRQLRPYELDPDVKMETARELFPPGQEHKEPLKPIRRAKASSHPHEGRQSTRP